MKTNFYVEERANTKKKTKKKNPTVITVSFPNTKTKLRFFLLFFLDIVVPKHSCYNLKIFHTCFYGSPNYLKRNTKKYFLTWCQNWFDFIISTRAGFYFFNWGTIKFVGRL